MSRIEVRAISKVYPPDTVAVDRVDLRVDDGEVLVLLGPTGSGKSTVLRLIAGLEAPTSGEVRLDGESQNSTSVRDRGVAMVFQDYALYPHLSVADHISFPLRHLDEDVREARMAQVVGMRGLHSGLHRRPGQLSGGQRHRVALARAIARPPRAFLFDQPLSSLDAAAREEVRGNVFDVVRNLGVATIYVTHDHVEALMVADRVAVMRGGRIEQVGTPQEVYFNPLHLFVAAFVGSPRMNLLQAAVYAEPDVRTVIDLGCQTLELPWQDPRSAVLAKYHTSRITVGVRPEAFSVTADGPNVLKGIVRMVELRGHSVLVHLETGLAPTPHITSHLDYPDVPGSLAQVAADPEPRSHPVRDRLLRLVPRQRADERGRYAVQPAYDAERDGARQALGDLVVTVVAAAAPRLGETMAVTLDIDQVHLFDGDGERIPLPAVPRGTAQPEVRRPPA
ncbi:MAG: multiple sugar transport system ATP-binding protein [Micromonosporaceae bacterium]|nr:multiple sugar transport system ATP-binding protein [Micromonosporaceae bacterium]